MDKTVEIDYLYLDLQTCDRCITADRALEDVIAQVSPALELAGYAIRYRKTEIATVELAEQYRFLASPTIRVNGQDICPSVEENACNCCSQISGTAMDCRVFTYEGRSYETPPAAMLAEAILRLAFAPLPPQGEACRYQLPDNLRDFFQGKAKRAACCCSSGCC